MSTLLKAYEERKTIRDKALAYQAEEKSKRQAAAEAMFPVFLEIAENAQGFSLSGSISEEGRISYTLSSSGDETDELDGEISAGSLDTPVQTCLSSLARRFVECGVIPLAGENTSEVYQEFLAIYAQTKANADKYIETRRLARELEKQRERDEDAKLGARLHAALDKVVITKDGQPRELSIKLTPRQGWRATVLLYDGDHEVGVITRGAQILTLASLLVDNGYELTKRTLPYSRSKQKEVLPLEE